MHNTIFLILENYKLMYRGGVLYSQGGMERTARALIQ